MAKSYRIGTVYRKPYSMQGVAPAAPSEVFLVDTASQAALREWIASWFDGQPHSVAGYTVQLPEAHVAFDRGDLPQPLRGVGITVVSETDASQSYLDDSGATHFTGARWTVYVRASGGADDSGNAEYRCRLAADALRALLQDPAASLPLARAGITGVRCQPARVLGSADYHVRMMPFRATVKHSEEWQPRADDGVVPAAGSMRGRDAEAIWYEWLSGYFNGASHSLQAASVAFPRAEIGAGRHDVAQPLANPSLAIVARVEASGPSEMHLQESGGTRISDRLETRFVIRGAGPDPKLARFNARRAADLLYALLSDGPATGALARRGIHHLMPSKPQTLPDSDFATREVRVVHRLAVVLQPSS